MDSGGFPEREVLPVASRRGWWLSHALAPAVLFLVVLALLQFAGGDHALADRLYDAHARRWLLDASLPLSRRVYEAQRGAILAVALAGVGVLLAGYWRPDARRWRRVASYVLLCLAVTTVLVSAGKQVTNVHCPRALARYGGGYPDVGLFEQRPGGLGRGVCYPAGHSSAAFAFVSLYFALGAWRARRRWAGLTVGLGAGFALAATQWARGMHFPSHDLTSAALAWAVALIVYVALYRRCLWETGRIEAPDGR